MTSAPRRGLLRAVATAALVVLPTFRGGSAEAFARSSAAIASRGGGHPAPARTGKGPTGRPQITLDRLDLSHVPTLAEREKAVRDMLAREARHVDWGAGRGARISYRFRVDDLSIAEEAGVLRLTCNATGWLPKGKIAKSRIAFGGAPADREALVDHVLRIVARGVLTRLGEMERERRSP